MNVITELPNNILQTEKGKLKINACANADTAAHTISFPLSAYPACPFTVKLFCVICTSIK